MRKFAYYELGQDHPIIVTEDEIRETYYPYWQRKMKEIQKEEFINFENCLNDWIVVNWAWLIEN